MVDPFAKSITHRKLRSLILRASKDPL